MLQKSYWLISTIPSEPFFQALFAHCGSPDATSDTACAQNVLKMHSCQSTFQGGAAKGSKDQLCVELFSPWPCLN